MARTKKGSKGPGYDFWSKRSSSKSLGYGPTAKQITKEQERMKRKQQLAKIKKGNTDD